MNSPPNSWGCTCGSELKAHLGDGTPTTLTVAAVYTRGLGFGDLTLPHDLVARHMDNPLAATVLVAGDSDRSRLAAALQKFPGIAVLAPATADRLHADRQQQNAEVNYLAMGLVLAFTAIAVVNTLAMSVSERIREFAMLRLAGATRRQVLRMLRIEALSVLLIAAVLGTGIALAVLTAFSIGMTGSAAPTVLPSVYASVVGAAALLALVATALPGRLRHSRSARWRWRRPGSDTMRPVAGGTAQSAARPGPPPVRRRPAGPPPARPGTRRSDPSPGAAPTASGTRPRDSTRTPRCRPPPPADRG